MKEIWKPIEGYEGHYSVSNLGRVRSEERTIKRCNGRTLKINEKFLKHRKFICLKRNYVTLNLNRKIETISVSDLVANAFLRPRKKGERILNKNGDWDDNRPDNLFFSFETICFHEHENQMFLIEDGFLSAKKVCEELKVSVPSILKWRKKLGVIKTKKPCSFQNCSTQSMSKSLCKKHYHANYYEKKKKKESQNVHSRIPI